MLPPKKEFDSKFGILSPSSSVMPELEYWREQCDLRGVGLALAYMDIDNFKAEFNSKYTETVVDLECLPAILRHLEAHAFKHGVAFHEGGDEFILLLPNVEKEEAIESLDRLRISVSKMTFHSIKSIVTFSIGMCYVGQPDCPLSDAEIRLLANKAKQSAKAKEGKNCIVSTDVNGKYDTSFFTKVRPPVDQTTLLEGGD